MLDRSPRPIALARQAGALYLIIIVAGIGGAALVRGPLLVPDDPALTAANLVAHELPFRLSILADVVMALADVALGVLMYVLLRPAGSTLSLMAMAFRLAQAAAIGVNLLNLHVAVTLAGQGAFADPQGQALASAFFEAHGAGYDLSLFFFGVNCLLVGALIARSGFLPRALGIGVGVAGLVYLGGSTVHVVAPQFVDAVAPLYGIPVLAELALCGWLLVRGLDARQWHAAASMVRGALPPAASRSARPRSASGGSAGSSRVRSGS
ncbi:DUF4386 domain-containing protein [Enhygromyxa salina]|uniref:DUF4386 domain-containing protein n=1 Tax=Enhygromyxa salina TaxID=215803 RepID=A0A2S9YTX3_9BACT|nr:DUF4386 domain-containing protein [Enhygromyxa salina]PRQ08538.1 hypothetical protein ENSA7_18240 [Enhygromyxa salina]